MKPTLLFIDDDRPKYENSSLAWELQDLLGKEFVRFIENPVEALDFIKENIDLNLIVLLDIQFNGMNMNGHEVLKEIRDISEIIPVIVFSGIAKDASFVDFINNHAFAFIDKDNATSEIVPIVRKAIEYYETSLDNTIEDWIISREGDKDKPIFFTANGDAYTLNQILREVRMQTTIGKVFARKLNELSIDLLLRNKEKLNG